MTYHRVCNQINITGATSVAGTAYPSCTPEFPLGFQWGSCYSIFSFMCMFCRSQFVLLYFFFWPLFCLFFNIQILITSLWYLQSLLTEVSQLKKMIILGLFLLGVFEKTYLFIISYGSILKPIHVMADILDYYDLDIKYFIKNQPMIVHQNCSSNPHYENSYGQVKVMKEFA